MDVKSYSDPADFLAETQEALESNEVANSLMLGICSRLVRTPIHDADPPCLKTVRGKSGLVLAAIMTPPHKMVVCGHQGDLHGGATLLVKDVLAQGWRVPGVFGQRDIARIVTKTWSEATGAEHVLEERLRVYELREVQLPIPERGRLRQATEVDMDLVSEWSSTFQVAILQKQDEATVRHLTETRISEGTVYLWEAPEPVSMAMKTRPTRHGISVALVYTPPELRRRGFGTACVGELSRLLLKDGHSFCSLFANLENDTAIAMYHRIGYRPVCNYDQFAFRGSGEAS